MRAVHVHGQSVFRETEYTLGEDIAKDLRCLGPDSARLGKQLVKRPLPPVRCPGWCSAELTKYPEKLPPELCERLVEMAPVELGGPPRRNELTPAQSLGQHPITVELNDPSAADELRQSLAD